MTDKLKPEELAARPFIEQWQAWGNALADEAADIGRAMHFPAKDRPVLGAGKMVVSTPLPWEAEQVCIRVKAVLGYIAKALPLFPRHQG